jgi:hypothetical protein
VEFGTGENLLVWVIQISTESRRSSGRKLYAAPRNYATVKQAGIWNNHPISFFLKVQRISDRSPFLAIQYDQVGSPPAHRQQFTRKLQD